MLSGQHYVRLNPVQQEEVGCGAKRDDLCLPIGVLKHDHSSLIVRQDQKAKPTRHGYRLRLPIEAALFAEEHLAKTSFHLPLLAPQRRLHLAGYTHKTDSERTFTGYPGAGRQYAGCGIVVFSVGTKPWEHNSRRDGTGWAEFVFSSFTFSYQHITQHHWRDISSRQGKYCCRCVPGTTGIKYRYRLNGNASRRAVPSPAAHSEKSDPYCCAALHCSARNGPRRCLECQFLRKNVKTLLGQRLCQNRHTSNERMKNMMFTRFPFGAIIHNRCLEPPGCRKLTRGNRRS